MAETQPSWEFRPQFLVLTSLAPADDPVLEVCPSRTSAVIGVQASPLTLRSRGHFGVQPSSVCVASLELCGSPHPGCAAEPGPDAPLCPVTPCLLAVRSWSACLVWARPTSRPLHTSCLPPAPSHRPSFWPSEFSPCPHRCKDPQTSPSGPGPSTSPSVNSGQRGHRRVRPIPWV